MLACRVMHLTPVEWRALPDTDKDDIFRYLAERDQQLTALRETLISRKAASAEALTLILLEGL